jgi:hypothetical protein
MAGLVPAIQSPHREGSPVGGTGQRPGVVMSVPQGMPTFRSSPARRSRYLRGYPRTDLLPSHRVHPVPCECRCVADHGCDARSFRTGLLHRVLPGIGHRNGPRRRWICGTKARSRALIRAGSASALGVEDPAAEAARSVAAAPDRDPDAGQETVVAGRSRVLASCDYKQVSCHQSSAAMPPPICRQSTPPSGSLHEQGGPNRAQDLDCPRGHNRPYRS